MITAVQPGDLAHASTGIPLLSSYRTTRREAKLWITPENLYLPLGTLHWKYFEDVLISKRYRVKFDTEQTTRLAALRVGFIRVNYEINGGRLTVESMRWDQATRAAIRGLIAANPDSIDNLMVRILSDQGTVISSRCRSFLAAAEVPLDSLDELLRPLNPDQEEA